MNLINIAAKTIPDGWFQLLYNVTDLLQVYNQNIQRGSFENEQYRLQFPGTSIYIEYPEQDIVPVIPAALGIPVPTDMNYIEDYFANYLMNPELAENETYKYASRIHKQIPTANRETCTYCKATGNVDGGREGGSVGCPRCGNKITSLQACIDMLKETPLTNHAIIEIAQPEDITCCVGKDGKNDPPCLRLIDFKVIPPDILTVSVYFRSWDLWAGLPTNLGGLELLKQYVAEICGFQNGPMYAYSSGLHIYSMHEEITRIRTAKQ